MHAICSAIRAALSAAPLQTLDLDSLTEQAGLRPSQAVCAVNALVKDGVLVAREGVVRFKDERPPAYPVECEHGYDVCPTCDAGKRPPWSPPAKPRARRPAHPRGPGAPR